MPTYAPANWVIIISGNGLSPLRHQAITWANDDLLSIAPLNTNFGGILYQNTKIFVQENALEHVVCTWAAILFILDWGMDE